MTNTQRTTRTRDSGSVLDTEYVAYVFNQRGYHVNEFAGRLDMAPDIIEGFLRGAVEPRELRIATLVNMADLLGIPFHALFVHPDTPDPSDVETNSDEPNGTTTPVDHRTPDRANQPTAGDAEQLIATTYATGEATPVLVADLASAFGWTTDRVHKAVAEASRRLAPAGLKAVVTAHSGVVIAPVNDHLDATRALAERKVYERGLSYIHYKAVHQVLSGQPVTVTNSGRQRLRTLGGLVNLDILTQAKKPAFTDEALEAFI